MAVFTVGHLWLFLVFQLAGCVLELPVFSNSASYRSRPQLRTRQSQGTVDGEISDNPYWDTGAYYIDVTIGSPAQRQTIYLSTGSSDLFFNSINAKPCNLTATEYGSCRGGTFNSSASTTYREASGSPIFNISYADSSRVLGPYGIDVLGIGSSTIPNVQFGVAEFLDVIDEHPVGVMGLGYPATEAIIYDGVTPPYSNVPEVMVRENVTASRLYSITLGRAGKL